MAKQNRLTRIEKILDHIHEHLGEPIHVASLAQKSCWSRWQFQRVFSEATGQTVAQYIRALRLSKAAELLLSSKKRHVDIALQCGFDSEISFSRAFKQMFQCTPRAYRQRGKRKGLRTPSQFRATNQANKNSANAFTQIHIENHASLQLIGKHDWIHGPFSSQPDFMERVPNLWNTISKKSAGAKESDASIGVIDTRYDEQHPEQMHYWAGYFRQEGSTQKGSTQKGSTQKESTQKNTTMTGYNLLQIPPQEYAVIPVHGPSNAVETAVEWFIYHWLPQSNYDAISGFELEIYGPNYHPTHPQSYMEYWIPIKPRETS